jgi:hypothetical protein
MTQKEVTVDNTTMLFRFFKRVFIIFTIFVLAIYAFKGILYRNLIGYKEIKQRKLIAIENKAIKDDLDFWLNTNNAPSVTQIIDFACEYATDQIAYTFGKCPTNPNQIIMGDKKTNCIGYSASLHTVVTYLLDKKGLSSQVKSEHKVGQLYLLDVNMHGLFKDPAFKDHDYNVIYDLENNKKYVIDPTIYTNLGIRQVTEK